jgi:hypothetical protein
MPGTGSSAMHRQSKRGERAHFGAFGEGWNHGGRQKEWSVCSLDEQLVREARGHVVTGGFLSGS